MSISNSRSKKIQRIVEGLSFTFELTSKKHVGFDGKVSYNKNWYWGADVHNSRNTCKPVSKRIIYQGLKYQVKSAQMRLQAIKAGSKWV